MFPGTVNNDVLVGISLSLCQGVLVSPLFTERLLRISLLRYRPVGENDRDNALAGHSYLASDVRKEIELKCMPSAQVFRCHG